MGDLLSAAQPKEVTGMLSSCMNDPAFMEAFKKNNADLARRMDQLTQDAAGAVPASDFLKNLTLSSDQKRECLHNGADAENALAKFTADFALDNQDDPGSRKLNSLMAAIASSVDKAKNNEASNKFQEFKEAEVDQNDLVKLLNKTPLFDSITAQSVEDYALNGIGGMADKQIDDMFSAVANDP